jgi:NTE family protein
MKKRLAIALSGGGARGALEVGALQALYEAGYVPDIMTGTSIGAANAAFLAVHGFNKAGLDRLTQIWIETMHQNLMSGNLWWQTMRALVGREDGRSQQRVRELAIASGLTPDLRFGDIQDIKLFFLATDLASSQPVIFGLDPGESVLEAMLASMTLPPWMSPVHHGKQYLVDGGLVSNLPIETAIHQGATEVIALDIMRLTETEMQSLTGAMGNHHLGHMLAQLETTLENRVLRLEMELADAYGIPVRYVCLTCDNPPPFWDFSHSQEMIEHGYQVTRDAIGKWQHEKPHWWRKIPIKAMAEGFVEVME